MLIFKLRQLTTGLLKVNFLQFDVKEIYLSRTETSSYFLIKVSGVLFSPSLLLQLTVAYRTVFTFSGGAVRWFVAKQIWRGH
jgi:hypothetical protein